MGDQIVLCVQSFGRESEYRRASLTVLSYYAYSENNNLPVLLFTDNPEWFAQIFSGFNVSFVTLTAEKIKQMRGGIDFLHRMKIALIEETFQYFPEHKIFYADSDTFFTDAPEKIAKEISAEKSSMHLWEYKFEAMKDFELPAGKTFQDFYKLITTKDFKLANGTPIHIDTQMVSWNAGVMIFHPDHKRFIPDVYTLTDQFYPETQNHASEQYAFSIMMQTNTEIVSCEAVNYHYWYRIKKQIADQFLEKEMTAQFHNESAAVKLIAARRWTKSLPGIFESHVWMTRDHAVQSFNTNKFAEAYRWSAKAILQSPLSSGAFIKDVLYHLKRQIKSGGK